MRRMRRTNCRHAKGSDADDGRAPINLPVMATDEDTSGRDRAFSEADYPLQELTGRIIGACFQVHHDLGYGYLESPYRRAMAVELTYQGIAVAREVPFELFYRGAPIGCYRADLIAESSVLVEVKTGPALDPNAMAQVLNYLKVSRLPIGLILHFGPKPKIRRVIATRDPR